MPPTVAQILNRQFAQIRAAKQRTAPAASASRERSTTPRSFAHLDTAANREAMKARAERRSADEIAASWDNAFRLAGIRTVKPEATKTAGLSGWDRAFAAAGVEPSKKHKR